MAGFAMVGRAALACSEKPQASSFAFSVATRPETAHALRGRKGDDMETWHWALVAVAGGVVFLIGLAMMKKGR